MRWKKRKKGREKKMERRRDEGKKGEREEERKWKWMRKEFEAFLVNTKLVLNIFCSFSCPCYKISLSLPLVLLFVERFHFLVLSKNFSSCSKPLIRYSILTTHRSTVNLLPQREKTRNEKERNKKEREMGRKKKELIMENKRKKQNYRVCDSVVFWNKYCWKWILLHTTIFTPFKL